MSSPFSQGSGNFDDPFASLRDETEDGGISRPSNRAPLFALLAVLVLALIGLAFVFLRGGDSGAPVENPTATTVTAPTLIGLTQEEALNRIAAAGLKPGEILAVATDREEPGNVVRQAPPSGAVVTLGDTIDFTVAQALAPRVPNVVGLSEEEALNAILAAGLALGAVFEENSEAEGGTVLKQSRPAGTEVTDGASVDITVSNGKSRIPDLVGKSADEATTLLQNAGFDVIVEEVPSDGSTGVLTSDPASGTFAVRGSAVTIIVAEQGGDLPPSPIPTQTPTASPTAPPCDSLSLTQAIRAEADRYGAEFAGITDFKCSGRWVVVDAVFGTAPSLAYVTIVGQWDGSSWRAVPTADACRPDSGLPASLYPRACAS